MPKRASRDYRLEWRFRQMEELIRSDVWGAQYQVNGGIELHAASQGVEERWIQEYVRKHYKNLGFSKVEGPFSHGPDFRVARKTRWAWAEVETRWKNYGEHGHHLDPSFREVKYLILYDQENPPSRYAAQLPPEIIHLDHVHFLDWFARVVAKPQMAQFRLDLIAAAMREYWVEICCDKERDMATCPDCDSCAYFGAGEFGKATLYFRLLAAKFMAQTGVRNSRELDLTTVKSD